MADSAATIVKSAIQPASIIKGLVGTLVLFAIFDLTGLTNWILFPVTTARNKFSPPSGS